MADSNLQVFVHEALSRGESRESIRRGPIDGHLIRFSQSTNHLLIGVSCFLQGMKTSFVALLACSVLSGCFGVSDTDAEDWWINHRDQALEARDILLGNPEITRIDHGESSAVSADEAWLQDFVNETDLSSVRVFRTSEKPGWVAISFVLELRDFRWAAAVRCPLTIGPTTHLWMTCKTTC